MKLRHFITNHHRPCFLARKDGGGKGGFDIFHTDKTAADEWSAPENMGSYLNTKEDELYYSYHTTSKFAYYVSGEYSKDKIETDIFEARVFVDYQIRTFDKQNQLPLGRVKIEIEDLQTGAKGIFKNRI